MSAFTTHCDICNAENAVPSYGDWQCIQCGQKYEYDESDRISLTDAQWALLRNPPRWIPVTERLPDDGVEVLVSVDENSDDCGYHVCLYRGDEWVRSESGSGYIFGVTHWMPLPEPPEVTK